MRMTFWWSWVVPDFIFPGYDIKTVLGLTSTCFGLGALAVFFEWLKLIQARIRQRELFLRARQIRTVCPPSESATLLFDTGTPSQDTRNPVALLDRVLLIVWDALVWLNLQILGYLLMLVVMAYNGWMVLSLVLGSGLGYYLFGPSFMQINLQNCQAMRDTFCAQSCVVTEQEDELIPALYSSTSHSSHSHVEEETSVCVHHSKS